METIATPYIAHKREDGEEQPLVEHLSGTAELARRFAGAFGAEEWGRLCGLAHDIGKYSTAFQRRIRGSTQKVDHSTAGCAELFAQGALPAAFCVAGHHGGLPDRGSRMDTVGEPTLIGRVKRARSGALPDYSSFKSELTLPATPAVAGGPDGVSSGFFTRMLYSCLVDADYLDTEAFMGGQPAPRGGAALPQLMEKLQAYLEKEGFLAPDTPLNQRRADVLQACIKGASGPRGLYSLTVPTGGGKTIASLAFAMHHANQHKMDRIIYVIPYLSIIDQTAEIFAKIFGEEHVLQHHSGVLYENDENATPQERAKALASENWDAPIVVTTAVQFFESLYANKSSRCRKLHNIANSIVIFDEAQMLPLPCLSPCVSAIGQLADHFGATAVLCTATQPALAGLFKNLGHKHPAQELCPAEVRTDRIFQRTQIRMAGEMKDAQLAEELNALPQVLCILNNRAQAQSVFEGLAGEGNFHLSTLMYPAHRGEQLKAIRDRLRDGEPCRVVSTSLIEAGVDVDFPAVFRAEAGLDSILQAAGRCNREGKNSRAEECVVTVFAPEAGQPAMLRTNIGAMREAARANPDLNTPEAIEAYFKSLLDLKGSEALDKHGVLQAFKDGLNGNQMPFRSVAERFSLIDAANYTVYIPLGDGEALVEQLRANGPSRPLLRKLGRYGVTLYDRQYEELLAVGDIEAVGENAAVLVNTALYGENTGLSTSAEQGKGFFL